MWPDWVSNPGPLALETDADEGTYTNRPDWWRGGGGGYGGGRGLGRRLRGARFSP